MYSIMNITTLYVSQEYGNDRNRGFSADIKEDGTGPLKTIEKALEIISQIRLFGAVQPITIRILDGVYKIDSPIIIKNDVNSVTIEPNDKTLIMGGVEVRGFKKDEFNGVNCFSVDMSDKPCLNFSDFYVNGKAAKLTRFPDSGFLEPEDVENHSSELRASSKWFIAKEDDFNTIKNFKNINDCIISFNHYWVDEHTPIESFDAETRKIEFKYLSRFTIELTHPASALKYIVENVAEAFKNPNEWYYDSGSKKLYYIPENENIKAEEIIGYIPLTDKLVCLVGEPEKKIKNITFRNFDMAYTKGDYKSKAADIDNDDNCETGYASDAQAVCNAHGSVELTHAYSCAIENCRMYCTGIHCIVVKDGCSRIRLSSNEMKSIGGGGIVIGGGAYGSNKNLHTYSNIISNNTIMHGGNRYFAACGILVKHSYENVISHNEIGYMYYTGISCGWVWGYTDSITHDNIIEKNHIHHLGSGVLSDMGGIYLLGRQCGTIIRNNYIHDIASAHYGGWALYTDEGSTGITIENNICHDTSDNSFHQHFGSMNVVRNNVFAFSKTEAIATSRPEMHTGIIVERNIIVTNGTAVFREGYSEKDKGCIQMIFSNNNIVFDISENEPKALKVGGKEYSFDECEKIFGLKFEAIVENPLFENLENREFILHKNSPAFKLGFKPIDMSNIGVIRR